MLSKEPSRAIVPSAASPRSSTRSLCPVPHSRGAWRKYTRLAYRQHQTEAFGKYVEKLIAAFEDERDDHGLRRWLLELIGEARSPLTLPTLAEQLYSEDESLRSLAVRGLEQLGTPPARQELWKARANGSVP
ncbi:HEAT repeat domain-containing protein [Amycolatopsis tucumanensis]|uniref:HEAT repeat domain-containing protein n=1 Tax=Amycolatopsis tucumanensis TaxID=401106 RepID=UPI0035571809